MTSKTDILRMWATPLTIGAFFLISVTGVLMFFGLDRGLMTGVHKWFSWVFLAGVGGHIATNFRSLKKHLQSRRGTAIIVAFMIILAASFFSWGIITGSQLERPILQALLDSPLSALASVSRKSPNTLLGRLKMHGIVATEQQSLHEISVLSGIRETRLLALVFLSE